MSGLDDHCIAESPSILWKNGLVWILEVMDGHLHEIVQVCQQGAMCDSPKPPPLFSAVDAGAETVCTVALGSPVFTCSQSRLEMQIRLPSVTSARLVVGISAAP